MRGPICTIVDDLLARPTTGQGTRVRTRWAQISGGKINVKNFPSNGSIFLPIRTYMPSFRANGALSFLPPSHLNSLS